MIVAILRIVLLLMPVAFLILWLRWRVQTARSETELDSSFSHLRTALIVMILVTLAAGLGLKLSDDQTGDPRTKYIPPHTENGKVVPGRFVPADEDDSEESGTSDQNPG